MKLVVKNIATDLKPCFLVYTETGELVENVRSIKVSEEAMIDVLSVEIEFFIKTHKFTTAEPVLNQVEIT